MLILILLITLAVVAVGGTVVAVRHDGHHRRPTVPGGLTNYPYWT